MQNEKHISFENALRFGWNAALANLPFFLGLFFVFLIVGAGVSLLEKFAADLTLPLQLAASVIQNLMYYIFLTYTLEILAGQKAEFSTLRVNWERFGLYFLGSILFSVGLVLGFIFLIIPGIWLFLTYWFYGYLIAEGVGIGEAFQKSKAMTSGVKWELFLFVFVIIGVNLLGLVALGVGLFVSIPVSMLASVHVYQQVKEQSGIIIAQKQTGITPPSSTV